jgi:hypothetical protein
MIQLAFNRITPLVVLSLDRDAGHSLDQFVGDRKQALDIRSISLWATVNKPE